MREIKFRLWLPKINKMLYNEDVDTDKFKELQKLSDYDYPFEGDEFYPWHSVFNWIGLEAKNEYMIPLEYTGLKDKNGVEICEGDIIPYHFNENIKGVVKFGQYKNPCDDKFTGHQGFYIDFDGESKDYYRKDLGYWATVSEVIGNIYENPKLLENK